MQRWRKTQHNIKERKETELHLVTPRDLLGHIYVQNAWESGLLCRSFTTWKWWLSIWMILWKPSHRKQTACTENVLSARISLPSLHPVQCRESSDLSPAGSSGLGAQEWPQWQNIQSNNQKRDEAWKHMKTWFMLTSENELWKYSTEIQAVHFRTSHQHTDVLYIHTSSHPTSFCTVSPSRLKGPPAIWQHLSPVLNYMQRAHSQSTFAVMLSIETERELFYVFYWTVQTSIHCWDMKRRATEGSTGWCGMNPQEDSTEIAPTVLSATGNFRCCRTVYCVAQFYMSAWCLLYICCYDNSISPWD